MYAIKSVLNQSQTEPVGVSFCILCLKKYVWTN